MRPELGSGPLTSPVLVLGRDYGSEEKRLSRPFSGPAGAILDATLKQAGWGREGVRVDNLVPLQPPGNDWSLHRPADLAWGDQRLRQLIAAQRPKLIVGLGMEVARWLLGPACPDAGIQELRGFLWDTQFGRVLTTVHPAGVLRDWTPWRALLNLDMKRARAELDMGAPPLTTRSVVVCTRPGDVDELRDAIHAETKRSRTSASEASGLRQGVGPSASRDADHDARPGTKPDRHGGLRVSSVHGVQSDSGWVSCDIENTRALELACMGFAPSPERAWVIPATEAWQRTAIRELCEAEFPKVLQNGQYDRFFLERFCSIRLRGQVFDTQLAWHSLQPELAGKKLHTSARKKTYSRTTVKSLRFLSSIYTRDPWYKNYAFETEEDRWRLCGLDCCVTLDIALKQAAQLA